MTSLIKNSIINWTIAIYIKIINEDSFYEYYDVIIRSDVNISIIKQIWLITRRPYLITSQNLKNDPSFLKQVLSYAGISWVEIKIIPKNKILNTDL